MRLLRDAEAIGVAALIHRNQFRDEAHRHHLGAEQDRSE